MSGIRKSFSGNAAATTLDGANTSTAALFSLSAIVGFPDTTVGPFVVCIDRGTSTEEKILCESYSGTTVTVATRGYDNTTAQAHSIGAVVNCTLDANTVNQANDVVNGVGTVEPTASAIGDTALEGTSAYPAAADHRHARESFSSGGTTTSAVGDTAHDGGSSSVARADHEHGRESFGTSATVSALGDAQAPGTAATPSRSDHKHGRESFVGSTATPAAPTQAGAAGTATTPSKGDHSHPFGQVLELTDFMGAGSSALTGKLIKVGKASGTTSGSGRLTVNYSTPFPSATDVVILTDISSLDSVDQTTLVDLATPATASGFTAIVVANAAPVVGSVSFYWMAFGE